MEMMWMMRIVIPTNEIQDFTLNGDTLLLSNSNFVVLGPLLDSLITIDYDSLANSIIADSNFSVGGVMNWKYPDGYNGVPVYNQGDYTVPSGKTLYITVPLTFESTDVIIDDVNIVTSPMNRTNGVANSNPIVAASGQVVSGGGTFHGLLFDNSIISPISWRLSNGPNALEIIDYVVPTGKKLVILQQQGTVLRIDGMDIAQSGNSGNTNLTSLGNPIIVSEGQVVSGISYSTFNGYLVDDDFFQNSGSSVNNGVTNGFNPTFISNISLVNYTGQNTSQTYNTIDVSAYIPSSATHAIINFTAYSQEYYRLDFRANSSSIGMYEPNHMFILPNLYLREHQFMVPLDSSGTFEYMFYKLAGNTDGTVMIDLVGYY